MGIHKLIQSLAHSPITWGRYLKTYMLIWETKRKFF